MAWYNIGASDALQDAPGQAITQKWMGEQVPREAVLTSEVCPLSFFIGASVVRIGRFFNVTNSISI